jgi:hypothetical protein
LNSQCHHNGELPAHKTVTLHHVLSQKPNTCLIQRYRALIHHLFGTQGLVEHKTTEPNISMEPGNILLARVGKNVDRYTADLFYKRLGTPRVF